jgi:hypothetical protein
MRAIAIFCQPTTEAARAAVAETSITPIEEMVRKFPTLTPQTNAREDGEHSS